MDSERLQRRFDAWEGRTRGLRSKPYVVPLEPAYRPLLGRERIRKSPVDDARQPGFLERLTTRPGIAAARSGDRNERSARGWPTNPVELQLLPKVDSTVPPAVSLAVLGSVLGASRHV